MSHALMFVHSIYSKLCTVHTGPIMKNTNLANFRSNFRRGNDRQVILIRDHNLTGRLVDTRRKEVKTQAKSVEVPGPRINFVTTGTSSRAQNQLCHNRGQSLKQKSRVSLTQTSTSVAISLINF
jgi:hypothetical protein